MEQVDNIIQYFIDLDTEKLIKDIACAMLEDASLMESFPKVIGIIILAIEDAKNSREASSNNEIYVEIYNEAVRLINKRNDS